MKKGVPTCLMWDLMFGWQRWQKRTSGRLLSYSLCHRNRRLSENVKGAHLQTCIWKSAMDSNPPGLNPTNFGWIKNTNSKILAPVLFLQINCPHLKFYSRWFAVGVPPIGLHCATARCGCCASQLACTIFCNWFLTSNCQNSLTNGAAELSD